MKWVQMRPWLAYWLDEEGQTYGAVYQRQSDNAWGAVVDKTAQGVSFPGRVVSYHPTMVEAQQAVETAVGKMTGEVEGS